MSDERPRVLWVVPRMTWPAVSGGEIRVTSLLLRLSSRYRLSLLAPAPASDPTRAEAAALLLESRGLERVHLVRRSERRDLGARAWLMPRVVQDFYEPALERKLEELLGGGAFSLVQLEFSEMGQYAALAARHAPVLLTEHDSGFLSWSRHYQRPEPSRYPGERAVEWARRVLYEAASFRRCRRVIALSEADAAAFSRLAPAGKIRVVPTGVELEEFPFAGLAGREPGTVLFVGFYGHYPNEDAAEHLCREILPRLPASARVILAGSFPGPRVRELAGERVSVTGTLPSVHPALAKARVFAAPVRLGRGIKGKVLEAFASGTPVVAYAESCEALPEARDGEHLLVARGPADFADKLGRVLADDALASRLAAAARAFVERGWSGELQAGKLDAVYRELLRE